MKKTLLASVIAISLNTQIAFSAPTVGNTHSQFAKPNIVLILTEDMNPRLGAYGDSSANTPNLDAFAKESVIFNHAFTMAGVSAPSRAGLITGAFQQTTGLQHMRAATFPEGGYVAVPPSWIKGYPELLRRNGYFTYVDIKTDYQFSDGPQQVGPFSLWTAHGDPKRFDDFKVPAAWENYDRQGKPFFINLNPQITHESGLFSAKNHKFPAGFEGLASMWDKMRSQYRYIPTDPASVKIDPFWRDTPNTRQELALFYDNIHIMDQQVGNVLERLKKDGLWDNTIVIFAADNGDCLPRHKREGYDSGTHVPLMIHVPDLYKPAWWPHNGTREERLVSFEDLAPTILGFSQTSIPFYMHGINLADDHPRSRQFVYANRDRMDDAPLRSYFVRSKDYQYVRNMSTTPNGVSIDFRNVLSTVKDLDTARRQGQLTEDQKIWFAPRPIEELYNLDKDPYQLHNLAMEPDAQEQLKYYRQQLDIWRNQQSNDMGLIPEALMVKDLHDASGQQKITLSPVAEQDPVTHSIFAASRTEGASIGYSYDGKQWEVYTQSLQDPGKHHTIYFKAVRYGWKESPVIQYQTRY